MDSKHIVTEVLREPETRDDRGTEKVDESRAGARLDEGRETERETGTMLSSKDKRTERKGRMDLLLKY